MTVERFEPLPGQLDRLSPSEYEALSELTLADLQAADNELPGSIEELEARLRRQIETPTQRLLNNVGTIADWERRVAEAVVLSMLAAFLLAWGGLQQLRGQQRPRRLLVFAKDSVQTGLDAIRYNGDRIASGQLTPGQLQGNILNRRSHGSREAYERARHLDLMVNRGHNEGKRLLTPGENCPDCPTHQRTAWTPLEEIVPLGTFCVCQAACKCRLITRFNPELAMQQLMGGNLLNQVERAQRFQDAAERQWRSRWE